MKSRNRISLIGILCLALGLGLLLPHSSASAQVVAATVTAGSAPKAVAVNTVTNKIYVANILSNNVTVIDGATNSTTTVPAGPKPEAVAVNETTNKIYVANEGCGISDKCVGAIKGNVTVIDGATNSTTTVTDPNATGPGAIAVDPVADKVYVANFFSSNVTVIDGATDSTTTITDPNAAGFQAVAVAVNAMTNKIYVVNNNLDGLSNTTAGNVTVIDGATNAITTVTDPNAISPVSIAVNSVTNKIYVANLGSFPNLNRGNITVIDGATNAITTLTDPNAVAPQSFGVNETTNTIYVANANDSALTGVGGVTIIDGTTNAISTVRDPNASFPHVVAVDPVSNTVYVVNLGCFSDNSCINPGSVTVINGATNSATTIINTNASNPTGLALDPTTDRIYVANVGSGNVTVIDGGAAPTTHVLSLLLAGSGSGTVTSGPAGINCPVSCTASFGVGTVVDLTASPSAGVTFSGWSTNCTGTGACDVTMSSDEFVTATFTNNSATDFSLQPASFSLFVPRGSQATDVITMGPVGGASFGNAIQLSCGVTVQPGSTDIGPRPTCALSPSSVTPGANSVTSTLTVTAPGQSARLMPSREGQRAGSLHSVFLPIPVLTLIGLGLAIGKPTNRRRRLWLLGSILVVFVGLQTGCGGGNSGHQTQPQNYIVTVNANSGAIQHTTQVIVIVP